jgi:hypothetical protein
MFMQSMKSISHHLVVRFRRPFMASTMAALLIPALFVGCGAGGMQGDALKYARLQQDFNKATQKAEQRRASGDEKGYLKELIDNAQPLGEKMLSIRKIYKSKSEETDAAFMKAVADAQSSLQ